MQTSDLIAWFLKNLMHSTLMLSATWSAVVLGEQFYFYGDSRYAEAGTLKAISVNTYQILFVVGLLATYLTQLLRHDLEYQRTSAILHGIGAATLVVAVFMYSLSVAGYNEKAQDDPNLESVAIHAFAVSLGWLAVILHIVIGIKRVYHGWNFRMEKAETPEQPQSVETPAPSATAAPSVTATPPATTPAAAPVQESVAVPSQVSSQA